MNPTSRTWRSAAPIVSAAIAFTLSHALGVSAAAQDIATAEAEFDAATEHFERGRFQLSLEAFERSYELMEGHPRRVLIVFNIARAQQQLGRYREAIANFERYIREAPPDAPFRDQAGEHIRDMRGRLAARGGDLGALDVSGIVVLSAGAAAALSAIPTGVLALEREAELVGGCDGTACGDDLRSVGDDLQALSTAPDVLWIAGVSVAAIGAALLVAGRVTSEQTTAAVACTGVGCVGTIQTRF